MFIDEVVKVSKIQENFDGIFKIQNIYEYMLTHYNSDIPVALRLMPSLMPPFKYTWWEFIEKSFDDIQKVPVGIATTLNESKYTGNRYNTFKSLTEEICPKCNILNAYIIFKDKNNKIGEYVALSIGLDEKGFALTDEWWYQDEYYSNKHEEISGFTSHWILTLSLALAFLNCKNVIKTPTIFHDKLLKARKKKNKPYFEKFYTLQIEPMKYILRKEGNVDKAGIYNAFHICRGHFRTYNEKPLFGKITGTFWIPDHVRGDASIGKIKKDYEIVV